MRKPTEMEMRVISAHVIAEDEWLNTFQAAKDGGPNPPLDMDQYVARAIIRAMLEPTSEQVEKASRQRWRPSKAAAKATWYCMIDAASPP